MSPKKDPYEKLPGAIIPWYRENARPLPWRRNCTPYHVWISEVMLQQTQAEAVKPYYERFLKKLPELRDLAQVPDERLLKLWEGLGYYTRARNLKKAANIIQKEYNGVFPHNPDELSALPGIGAYTAGAIASICFNKPVPAVDGNVLRVIARITACPDPVNRPFVKKQIFENLRTIYPQEYCGDFTQGLMELGATVCLPRGEPGCGYCPVSAFCAAHEKGLETHFSIREKRKPRKQEYRTVYVLCCDSCIAVRRREGTGLLAGLWELPNSLGSLTESEAISQAASWGVSPFSLNQTCHRKHIFTHVEWHMTGFYISCEKKASTFSWVNPVSLAAEITLPTAFKLFLR